ncbi:hypothetical protein HPB50_028850 [Hyalomma asiaticum]|nr:hypothetical protein HPB50_028850 [Hyalomma asiaticum]
MYDRRKHHQRWCARPGIQEREKLGDAVKVLFVVRNCDVDTWIPTTSKLRMAVIRDTTQRAAFPEEKWVFTIQLDVQTGFEYRDNRAELGGHFSNL